MSSSARGLAVLCLLIVVVGALGWRRWAAQRTAHHATPAPRPLLALMEAQPTRPGLSWAEWQRTPVATATDKRLKAALAQAMAHWRTRGGAPALSILPGEQAKTCYPFGKTHGSGQAVDVWVGDLDGDGRVTIADLCQFAAAWEAAGIRGGCGVYVWEVEVEAPRQWVHLEIGERHERWGIWHGARGVKREVLWSQHEPSVQARCRAWGLQPGRQNLTLAVDKQPSVLVFDAAQGRLVLCPALRVYVSGKLVKTYPVALGFDPVNDKEKRDDYRTPEGDFYICGFNAASHYHKSLRLSYPNAEDAERGLRSGLIDHATQRAIVSAVRRRRTPPQDTALGGDIMLHGGGGRRENWTWGCVALDNGAIDEIFDLVRLGTLVKVLPVRGN